ncbi:MAG: TraU family protein [Chlamydiota bacterium]
MTRLILTFFFASFFFFSKAPALAGADSHIPSKQAKGAFFNPITDVCWNCLFPIHLAGANLTKKSEDSIAHKTPICHCPGGLVGVPVAYWQPNQVVEVTMTPYKLVSFGGLKLSTSGMKKRGYLKQKEQGGYFEAFYHVHFYNYPVLQLLNAVKFVCTESLASNIGISYMSEFDPFWSDDSWNAILYPQNFIFANIAATAACIPDCIASTINKPTDKFFWCSGCQGSLLPYQGFVSPVRGGIQASSLLVHRILAKLHHLFALWTYEEGNYCKKKPSPYPPKTAYKIQIALPVKQTVKKCPALGASEFNWGMMKSFPVKGEEYVYVIWNRAHCCVDPYKTAVRAAGVAL